MSATGRGARRVQNDFYATPPECTRLLFDRVNWDKVGTVFEPCRGDGAIYKLIPDGPRKSWCEITEGVDYLNRIPTLVDFSPSNPPYSLATEFLSLALLHCRCVAYMLRLNYLGGQKRKVFLSGNRPTHVYVLTERPSFVDVCVGFPETKSREKQKGCGNSFRKEEAVKVCPDCGGHVRGGTDATEYAWICWDRKTGILKDEPGVYFL